MSPELCLELLVVCLQVCIVQFSHWYCSFLYKAFLLRIHAETCASPDVKFPFT